MVKKETIRIETKRDKTAASKKEKHQMYQEEIIAVKDLIKLKKSNSRIDRT